MVSNKKVGKEHNWYKHYKYNKRAKKNKKEKTCSTALSNGTGSPIVMLWFSFHGRREDRRE